jgi:succinate dehydrogenase / fumarate reductase cytochrome b subunit
VKKQPVFLELTKIYLPITALASILHRITGILLLAMMPLGVAMLYGLFIQPKLFMEYALISKYVAFAGICLYLYHVAAGARHMVAEVFHWHGLKSARQGAWFILIVWPLVCLLIAMRVL